MPHTCCAAIAAADAGRVPQSRDTRRNAEDKAAAGSGNTAPRAGKQAGLQQRHERGEQQTEAGAAGYRPVIRHAVDIKVHAD